MVYLNTVSAGASSCVHQRISPLQKFFNGLALRRGGHSQRHRRKSERTDAVPVTELA